MDVARYLNFSVYPSLDGNTVHCRTLFELADSSQTNEEAYCDLQEAAQQNTDFERGICPLLATRRDTSRSRQISNDDTYRARLSGHRSMTFPVLHGTRILLTICRDMKTL